MWCKSLKALVQRVSCASVVVNSLTVGEIEKGILLLLGIERDDTLATVERMVDKVLRYRLFDDESGKMNCSLKEVGGGLLVVSQFTLVADTKKGLRPSFSAGASPEIGKRLYEAFLNCAQESHAKVASGIFGADMKVSLLNDGPVTFLLEL